MPSVKNLGWLVQLVLRFGVGFFADLRLNVQPFGILLVQTGRDSDNSASGHWHFLSGA